MKQDTNREGMTFEEWVAAAGKAHFDQYGRIRPYTESHSRWLEAKELPEAARLRILGGKARRMYHRGYLMVERRRSVRWYPTALRKAWRRGEDPTEYRDSGTLRRWTCETKKSK